MKITAITVTAMEHSQPGRVPKIIPAGSSRRLRYTHEWQEGSMAGFEGYELFLRVQTDEGVEGVCTASSPEITRRQLEILRATVVGMDPLWREEIYQRLHLGTRWVYQPPGWFGNFDNCLWDIAGKVAGMPVCKLIGQVRDRIPAYHTSPGYEGRDAADQYLRTIDDARETWGITAYKFHDYRGPRYHIPLFRKLRQDLGDDYTLINDPVCTYSLREAIQVGKVMEELDFLWLEEPFREQELRQYQELCRELTIPVMATEMLMNDVNICAQWLLAGATDLVRANARGGTTALLKMAHFAELYGSNVELNATGGLGGHVHVNLQCAIANTELFEHFTRFVPFARECGITNPPDVVDGHLTPSTLPGWGAEIDWSYVDKRTVEVF